MSGKTRGADKKPTLPGGGGVVLFTLGGGGGGRSVEDCPSPKLRTALIRYGRRAGKGDCHLVLLEWAEAGIRRKVRFTFLHRKGTEAGQGSGSARL